MSPNRTNNASGGQSYGCLTISAVACAFNAIQDEHVEQLIKYLIFSDSLEKQQHSFILQFKTFNALLIDSD